MIQSENEYTKSFSKYYLYFLVFSNNKIRSQLLISLAS